MTDPSELAQESIERAHHAHHHHHAETETPEEASNAATRVAVLISALAAMLAIAEIGEKSAQNEYLTHHIAVSDQYAFYQAKTVRSEVDRASIAVINSLPNAADPEVRKRAADLGAEAARLDDDETSQGRKQLLAHAKRLEADRNSAFHAYHLYERVVGALQISIVLASVSVVTRKHVMAVAAGVIGLAAALFGVLVATDLV